MGAMDLTPIVKADSFNVSAPGANTNILSTSITPTYGSTLAIGVTLATSSVFNITETRSGTTFTMGLNASSALNAGDAYTFVWPCTPNSTYNFQVETNGVIQVLKVFEMPAGVA